LEISGRPAKGSSFLTSLNQTPAVAGVQYVNADSPSFQPACAAVGPIFGNV
jgi:hypothetical protein